MTGFGRCEVSEGDRKFTVEMKGVNHRYLDANIRMPKKLNFFDSAIRTVLKQYVTRGKVDIFITYEDLTENQVALKYNESLAKEYLDAFKKMDSIIPSNLLISTIYPPVLHLRCNNNIVKRLFLFD